MSTKNSYRKILWEGLTERLNETINKLDISQTLFAQVLGKSQPQIHHYLKGKSFPRPEVLQKMSYVLGVDYNWLRYGEEKMKFYTQEDYPYYLLWQNFAERLKFLLWTNDLTPVSLARQIKESSTLIIYLTEGNRYPSERMKEKLIVFFEVQEVWLFFPDDNSEIEKVNTSKLERLGKQYLEKHKYNLV